MRLTAARRGVPALAAAGLLAATAACSGPSEPAPTAGRAGDPAGTASPTGVSPPVTPTPPPPSEAVVAEQSRSAAAVAEAALDLPGCMLGTWTAPVAREFDGLGLEQRSGHAVRSGSGDLELAVAAGRTWTFTYRQVKLQLSAGTADVTGTVDGTWSLDGDLMSSRVTGSALDATMRLGGLTASAPGQLTDVLRGLAPDQVHVRCTATGLQLQLPGTQGGGTVTLDRTSGPAPSPS